MIRIVAAVASLFAGATAFAQDCSIALSSYSQDAFRSPCSIRPESARARPEAAANFDPDSSGALTGGTLTIFQWDSLGRNCLDDDVGVLMHEMGHVLGLGDPGHNDPGQACFGSVMGSWYWGRTPSIDPDDCAQAEDGFTTPIEIRVEQCSNHCEDGTCNDVGECIGQDGQPTWNPGTDWFDPLVFDLEGNGIFTTGPDAPVTFDLDADGHAESWTWISGGDAFLWTDSTATTASTTARSCSASARCCLTERRRNTDTRRWRCTISCPKGAMRTA